MRNPIIAILLIATTTPALALSPRTEALRQQAIAAHQRAEQAVADHCRTVAVQEPFVGMAEADLYCNDRYRWPSKTNTLHTASGTMQQLIYRHNGGTEYIYVSGGRVVSIQW